MLKGFQTVTIAPGETKKVKFELKPEAFAIWNDRNEFAAEPARSRCGSALIPRMVRRHKRRSCRRNATRYRHKGKRCLKEKPMKSCARKLSTLANLILLLVAVVWFTAAAWGSTEYYRHVVFDNSLTADAYFYSQGMANGSSFLELKDHRLPVETKTFLTPPNALRLQWQSQTGGGWEAEVHVNGHRNRFPELKGHNLYFWCFAPEAIAADDLPMLVLSNTGEGLQVAEFPGAFTEPLRAGKNRWRHSGGTLGAGANSAL